jgi:hypothetical protein
LVKKKVKLKQQLFQQFKKEKCCIKVVKDIKAKEKEQAHVAAL